MLLWFKERIGGGRHDEIRTKLNGDRSADAESIPQTGETESTTRYEKWLDAAEPEESGRNLADW